MSCQQVPRLTEDPYVFTEAVPTTPVLFNPQKSRLQHNPKSTTQITNPQQSIREATNFSINQQFFKSRFKGITTAIETPSASITQQQQIINGMQKNVISITTISNNNNNLSVPLQNQYRHQSPVTTPAVTVTTSTVSSCCQLPPQVISWNQTPTSGSLHAQHHVQQQQLFQQKQQHFHSQQQSFLSLKTSCSSTIQNLPSASTLLPPSNFHQNTLAQQLQKVGSTLTNTYTSNSQMPWSRPQTQPQQYSKVSVCPNKPPQLISTSHAQISENIVTCQVASSSVSQPTASPDALLKPNHSDINEIPVSVIYRTTSIKSEQEKVKSSHLDQLCEANATESTLVQKSLDYCEKNVVFATPAKRDSRVLSSSAKKSLKGASTRVYGKAKRSHSQTAHHEALERISLINHHQPSFSSSLSSIQGDYKSRRSSGVWHAPDTYIFDSVSPLTSFIERRKRLAEKCDITIISAKASCVQQHWLDVHHLKNHRETSERALNIGREERIERHKALLRRQAVQLISSHEFLKPIAARNRLVFVSKFLQKLKNNENSDQENKCCVPSCTNNALALTAQCYMHITRNSDQHLFLPCTAKFADNTQCRIPVFDISHELPLCREHGWKRDNYNRIIQEQKPKAKVIRKRTKSTVICNRPPKRSKKKRKGSTSSLESIGSSSTAIVLTPTHLPTAALTPPVTKSKLYKTSVIVEKNSKETIKGGYAIKLNDIFQSGLHLNKSKGNNGFGENNKNQKHHHQQTQDLLNICENSSVYASSEDTGVGGLSESELMVGTQEAEEIPLGDTRLLEEHDLTNVLNNLPVDAFNELFTAVHQDEREEVERALELADKQIKSLQQMTGSDTDFLRDLLDGNDQILDDTDICTEIVSSNSPDTSGIDTNTLFVDGGSNSTAGSCTGPTPADNRGLVQT